MAPAATTQSPVQQVEDWLHASPVWMHQEAPSLQVPPLQKREQHSVLAVQGFPAVRQAGLSGWQTPAEQLPLQQPAEALHAWLSATHTESQVPALQLREQQSVGTAQGPRAGVHRLMEEAQVLEAVSQIPVQHSEA